MKAIVQRVRRAVLTADGQDWSQIGAGLLILVGVEQNDTEDDAHFLAEKCARLRIFEDEQRKMNCSPLQAGAEALVISNFTLCGDCSGGNRPFFGSAARPEQAKPLYEKFAKILGETIPVKTGKFGADMQTETTLDGPVTLWLDSHVL